MSTFTSSAQMLRGDAALRQRRTALLFWATVDLAAIVFLYASVVGGAA